MKAYILIVIIILLEIPAMSQKLGNSKWKGVFLIPHAVDVTLNFKKDTLYLEDEKGQPFGTLVFSSRSDTLLITKISGISPCPEQSQGWYRIEWFENGNKFRLHGISDECDGRIGIFTTNPYERIHD